MIYAPRSGLIKAHLSELEAQRELPEESKKTVAVAVKNAEKLLSMVTQLLDLQKTELHAECLKVSPYDIKAYLEEKIAEFHMAVLQKGVEIQLKAEADMPQVWVTGIRWIILWTISFRMP